MNSLRCCLHRNYFATGGCPAGSRNDYKQIWSLCRGAWCQRVCCKGRPDITVNSCEYWVSHHDGRCSVPGMDLIPAGLDKIACSAGGLSPWSCQFRCCQWSGGPDPPDSVTCSHYWDEPGCGRDSVPRRSATNATTCESEKECQLKCCVRVPVAPLKCLDFWDDWGCPYAAAERRYLESTNSGFCVG